MLLALRDVGWRGLMGRVSSDCVGVFGRGRSGSGDAVYCGCAREGGGCFAAGLCEGAKLVVFPEALLGGYPRGAAFGAVVGERSPMGRDEFLAYSRNAVTVPGPEVERLWARSPERIGLHLVVGLIERVGTSLYCGAVTIDDAGRRCRCPAQGDADGERAADLGAGRRLDVAGRADEARSAGDRDLLGESDAGAADELLRAGRGDLVCADRGCA